MMNDDYKQAYLNAEKMNWDMPLYLKFELHPYFEWDKQNPDRIIPMIEIRYYGHENNYQRDVTRPIATVELQHKAFISTNPHNRRGLDEQEACRLARETNLPLYELIERRCLAVLRDEVQALDKI